MGRRRGFFAPPSDVIHPVYDLKAVKKDLWQVLQAAPWEAELVRLAIIEGEVDGSSYNGECCCIKGIIARNLGVPVKKLKQLFGISLNPTSPLEIFLFNLTEGDTPETSQYSWQMLKWLDEFIAGWESQKAARLREAVNADLEEVLAAALSGEAGQGILARV
jgi:hypothetical protein